MATSLADPLIAKKRFVASLTSYKKFLKGEATTKLPKSTHHKEPITKSQKKPTVKVKTIIPPKAQPNTQPIKQPIVRVKNIVPTMRIKKLKPKVRVKKPTIHQKTSAIEDVPPQIPQQNDAPLDDPIVIDVNKLTEDDFNKILKLLETRSR